MALYASIITYPPLNKLTVLPSPPTSPPRPAQKHLPTTTLPITALLTTAIDRPRFPFIVHLHYHVTHNSAPAFVCGQPLPPPGRWPFIPLTEVDSTGSQSHIEAASHVVGDVAVIGTEKELKTEHRRVFCGELDLTELKTGGGGGGGGGGRIRFAVRYLIDQHAGWRWEEAKGGVGLADVLVPDLSPGASRARVGDGVEEVKELLGLLAEDASWVVRPTRAGAAEGVFEVESRLTMPRIDDGEAAYGGTLAELALGKVKDQVRYMSLVRLEPYWLGVQHGMTTKEWEGEFEQSMDGVLVAFLLKSGKVLVVLGVNANEDVYTVIRSGEGGEVVIGARNDGAVEEKWRLLVTVGAGVEEGIAKVMKEAKAKVMKGPKMQKLLNGAEEIRSNTEMAKESWFDGLAYCTWNGMDMHRCSEKAVGDGIQILEDNEVKIETFLLDDCWQSAKKPDGSENIGAFDAGWDRFTPNKNFPRGLRAVVEEVKSKHKGIKNFGIWHALFGYWGGVAEGGWIARNYKTRRVATKYLYLANSSYKMLIVDPEDVERFYDDLYSWLKGEGIDFVKTDVQHMLSMLEDKKDREEVPIAYQRAWTLAVMKYFNGKVRCDLGFLESCGVDPTDMLTIIKAISCMSQSPQTLFHSLLQDKTPKVMHRNSDDFYPDIIGSNSWHIYVNAFNALLDRHLNVIPDWDMYQTEHAWSSYHTAARAISGGPILITDIPGKHDTKLVGEMTATNLQGSLIALRPKPAAAIDHWERYADGNLCKIGTSTGEGKHAAGILGLFNMVEATVTELVSLRDFPGVHAESLMLKSHRTNQVFGPLKRSARPLLSVTIASRGYDILTAYPVQDDGSALLGLQGKMSGAAAVLEQSVNGKKIKVSLKALGKLAGWSAFSDASIQAVHAGGKRVDDGYIKWKAHDIGRIFEIDLLGFWQSEELWCDEDVVEIEIDFT